FAPPLGASCYLVTGTPPTVPDTLSLHDALPICRRRERAGGGSSAYRARNAARDDRLVPRSRVERRGRARHGGGWRQAAVDRGRRSEEHTSELQSRENLVCRLLLEKKKNKRYLRE